MSYRFYLPPVHIGNAQVENVRVPVLWYRSQPKCPMCGKSSATHLFWTVKYVTNAPVKDQPVLYTRCQGCRQHLFMIPRVRTSWARRWLADDVAYWWNLIVVWSNKPNELEIET